MPGCSRFAYQRLLTAARDVVHCDAAALLRLDGEVLTPVAVDGLSAEALGRRFPIVAHHRFALLLESGTGLRFEPDCGLPDPYDGLVAGQPELLAATNRDLRAAISQGRFRADLYHRLSVYPLVVPPLRERGRDVLTLAGGFLEENQHRIGARNLRLTHAAKSELLSYSWPGNVRELEHLVSRAALRAFSEHPRGARWMAIEPRHLALERTAGPAVCDPATHTHPPARPYHSSSALHEMTLRDATDAFQREWLSAALSRHEGHMGKAAKAAGMDRSSFHRLLRRLGVLAAGPRAVPDLDACERIVT